MCLEVSGNSGVKLVWTQCAMGWIESCTTGPDQVNIGSPRKAVGAAEEPVGGRETADAGVLRWRSCWMQMQMQVPMLGQARCSG